MTGGRVSSDLISRRCLKLYVLTSADEHAQTSVSEHGDCHSPWPAGTPDGAEAVRRVAQGGRAATCRQVPSSRGRGAEGLCPGAASFSFRTPPRHRAPEPGPGRTLIAGDGAAGNQRAQNRPACPAIAATQRLRAVPSQRLPGPYDLRRTCRPVTRYGSIRAHRRGGECRRSARGQRRRRRSRRPGRWCPR
jgi:hypothetical protein